MALRDYKTKVQIMYPERTERVTVPKEMLNDFPIIPSSVVSILSECVEAADTNTAKTISALSASLQIQHGRMLSMSDEKHRSPHPIIELPKRELDIYILDAVEIYARAENLFGFARGDFHKHEFAPSRQDIQKKLIISDIHEEEYPEIWRRIDKEKRHASRIVPEANVTD